MIIEMIPVGALAVNCYIIARAPDTQAIVIDPGDEGHKILRRLEHHRLRPGIVVNTHGHYDHIGADDALGVAVYVHGLDRALLLDPQLNLSLFFGVPTRVSSPIHTVAHGDCIEYDGLRLVVLHTPGHTAGGISLFLDAGNSHVVFTGDSLFFQGIGRTDFPGASQEQLVAAIRTHLWSLPADTIVYPGHGPSSTIADEKRSNPYVNPVR